MKRNISARTSRRGMLGALGAALPAAAAPVPTPAADPTVAAFHKWYYDHNERTWNRTQWMGIPTWKVPLDLWVYQEIFHEVRPDVLIECGTWKGGSALFFAHMFDLLKKGRVITIDSQPQPNVPVHPRITYLHGSSTSTVMVDKVRSLIKPKESVMAVLDSDHRKAHVIKECQYYGPMVTPGSYLVVEDTNVNGHPVVPNFGPGPMEAVREYLAANREFSIDNSREKFGLTFNPNGFLRKKKA